MVVMPFPGFEDNLLVEFLDMLANELQNLLPLGRQPIILPRPASARRIGFALEPAQPLHPVQQGVQGAGADFIAVTPQFRDDPLPVYGLFRGVMEDMHLPEAQ